MGDRGVATRDVSRARVSFVTASSSWWTAVALCWSEPKRREGRGGVLTEDRGSDGSWLRGEGWGRQAGGAFAVRVPCRVCRSRRRRGDRRDLPVRADRDRLRATCARARSRSVQPVARPAARVRTWATRLAEGRTSRRWARGGACRLLAMPPSAQRRAGGGSTCSRPRVRSAAYRRRLAARAAHPDPWPRRSRPAIRVRAPGAEAPRSRRPAGSASARRARWRERAELGRWAHG